MLLPAPQLNRSLVRPTPCINNKIHNEIPLNFYYVLLIYINVFRKSIGTRYRLCCYCYYSLCLSSFCLFVCLRAFPHAHISHPGSHTHTHTHTVCVSFSRSPRHFDGRPCHSEPTWKINYFPFILVPFCHWPEINKMPGEVLPRRRPCNCDRVCAFVGLWRGRKRGFKAFGCGYLSETNDVRSNWLHQVPFGSSGLIFPPAVLNQLHSVAFSTSTLLPGMKNVNRVLAPTVALRHSAI